MTKETFIRLTRGVIGLDVTEKQTQSERTSALSIIIAIRYWKHVVPVRLTAVLDGGLLLHCRLRDEVKLWRALKDRGVLGRVKMLIPDDLRSTI